jgi:5'-nucleotidase
MRILISNDDGVFAPGIKALYQHLKDVADVYVVAPLEERSTTGHSLHLSHVLRLEKIEDKMYGCSGFPADCVLMGIGHLLRDQRPDLIVSGINRGPNLGQDLYYSGTLAAAREATFHSIPAIGVSLNISFTQDEAVHHYDTAARFIKQLVLDEIHKKIPPFTLLNVNVPNLHDDQIKGVQLTKIGFRRYSDDISERTDCRNRKYYWIAGELNGHIDIPGTDCVAVANDYIAVTPHKVIDSIETSHERYKDYIEELKWPKK